MFDTEGFILFSNEYVRLSESFRKEMARQLEIKFIERLDGDRDVFNRYYFSLLAGYDINDFNITVKGGIAYARVWLLCSQVNNRSVTVCWGSEEFTDKKEIHLSDISDKKVEFDFGDDFPQDDLTTYTRPVFEVKKGMCGNGFDLNLYVFSFPDVYLKFDLRDPLSEDEKSAIWRVFSMYNTENDLTFNLSGFNGNTIHLYYPDVKPCFTWEDIEPYMYGLISLFVEIGTMECGRKINKVDIK